MEEKKLVIEKILTIFDTLTDEQKEVALQKMDEIQQNSEKGVA